jgi:hypothetical protein
MNGRAWTNEEIAELRRRWPTDSAAEIAAALNRQRPGVIDKAYTLRLRKSNRGTPRAWTDEEITQLRVDYANVSAFEIAARLERKVYEVCAKAAELGVRKSASFKRTFAKKYFAENGPAHGSRWTEEQCALLRERFATTPSRELVAAVGHSLSAIHQQAKKLGLKKTEDHNREMLKRCGAQVQVHGACHRFAKGHVSANKGLRRPGWHRGRMRETQFKKGQMPKNHVGVGSITWSTGRIENGVLKNNYLKIKIAEPNTWRWLHRKTWEDAHGPIPRGYMVGFIDGDRGNCALQNLVLLSLADNARRNVMWKRYPYEVAQIIQLKGAIKAQITRRLKREQDRRSA